MVCVYSAGVSGVTEVTQSPPLITVSKGETLSLVCNTGGSTDGARWYKQVTGEAPQFILNSYHGWSSPKYGSGFSSSKFTVSYPTKSDCHLSVSNVDVDDSGVYYCHTWDDSAKEHVSQWFTAWQKPPHCSHSLLLLTTDEKHETSSASNALTFKYGQTLIYFFTN